MCLGQALPFACLQRDCGLCLRGGDCHSSSLWQGCNNHLFSIIIFAAASISADRFFNLQPKIAVRRVCSESVWIESNQFVPVPRLIHAPTPPAIPWIPRGPA